MGLFQALKGHSSHEGHARLLRPSGLTLLLVGVVPLALAACGGASASGSSTSTTKPSATASEAAYSACLKQHGVTLPSFTPGSIPAGGTRPTFTPGSGGFTPGSGAGGFRNNPKFAKAEAACKSLRPSGGFGGFGRGGSGGFNSAAFAAYRNCLKLHGVTLPTTFGARGGAGSTPTTTVTERHRAGGHGGVCRPATDAFHDHDDRLSAPQADGPIPQELDTKGRRTT